MKAILQSILLLFTFMNVNGQFIDIKHASRDTAYIKDFYRHYFILRVFECTKYNNFRLIDNGDKLVYKQNQHNDIGIGFNYKVLFLNVQFTMPFTEKNKDIFGGTNSFDVQTYFYLKKFVVDFYTQFYRGYYLSNGREALDGNQATQVIIRPDIKTTDLGVNVTYVFNDAQFSFNAPFTQNEIQRKSAGSILAGGSIYYSGGKGDSSFIPGGIRHVDFFGNRHFNKFSYSSIGVNLGYAYTQVIRKQFYAMCALTGGPGLGYSAIRYEQSGADWKVGVTYTASVKFAGGWSSDKYFAGVAYTRMLRVNNSVVDGTREEGNTGSFQVTVAKRFLLKKTLIPKSGIIKID